MAGLIENMERANRLLELMVRRGFVRAAPLTVTVAPPYQLIPGYGEPDIDDNDYDIDDWRDE